MEKIKLIALDMDGTTLQSDNTISDIDLKAINKAKEMGILIVPSTGRSLNVIPKEIIDLPVKYAITKNGSIIHDVENNKECYHEFIDKELALAIIKRLESMDVFLAADINGERVTSGKNLENAKNTYKNLHFDNRLVVDSLYDHIKSDHDHVIDKISILVADEDIRREILFEQRNYIDLNIMQTSPISIEINNRLASKGNALKWLANHLNLKKENIAAIGDSDNDLIMLCYAGYSFAMTNGTRYARETADEITLSNDENGVAFAIEKILTRNSQY
ncbi:MAG: Cof-type HAD-IIB family hydrolase [Erysipelotrichaceae bacterium]|nr:Cof-type HAD-IIB family hydrolase [Erysipelotrichaceae bacterium]MDD3924617.1 Cof-type HAD-IIB family hydrolase [Erysipelotrichaceae bacterium]MDD4642682.1 Cof-type HAD-IIB family hydrolase [Erysipelotrichaceae bacterium]